MALKSVHLASTHRAVDPRIFYKECRTLADAGYEVVLVVPHERDEVVDGVQIRAVPVPATGRDRLRYTLRAVYRRALDEGPDAIVHVHDAELLPAALALKVRGRTVVYDAHEDTPRQMLHQHWIPGVLRRPAGWGYAALELLAGRYLDGIITVVPDIARRYPPAKTALVRNFPILDEMVATAPAPYSERDAAAVYVGAITRARGALEMVEAVRRVPAQVELWLVGPLHPPELAEDIKSHPGAGQTRLLGYLDRAAVSAILARARVGLVTLHPTPMYEIAYPTKMFEYMAAGLPVVASDFPLWREIVKGAGCGIVVNPLDAGGIADALGWLLEHPAEAEAMGRRGQVAVRERYNWAHEGRRLVGFYERLGAGLPPAA